MTKKEFMEEMRLLSGMGFFDAEMLSNGRVLKEWYEAFEGVTFDDFQEGVKRYRRSETVKATIAGVKGYVTSAAKDRLQKEKATADRKALACPREECPDEILEQMAGMGFAWARKKLKERNETD